MNKSSGWFHNHNIYSKKFYKKGNRSLKRWLAVFFTSFLSVIVVAAVALTVIVNTYLGKLERGKIDHSEVDADITDVYDGQDLINIALFGIDSRYIDEPSRSDSIMILTIDRKHTKIKMTSIARDTYVSIDGHGKTKINHAYIYGGPTLSLKTLNNSFKLSLTDYATANFWALAKIIDYIGGVEVDVDAAEREDINVNYIPYIQEMGIPCEPIQQTGMQHLSGGQAVAYCRVRHVGGDVMRGERQREVLMSMYEDVKRMSPLRYPKLVSTILEECSTSLTNAEIMSIGTWAMANVGSLKFETLGMPTDDMNAEGKIIDGIWYFVYDLNVASKRIENFILENVTNTQTTEK